MADTNRYQIFEVTDSDNNVTGAQVLDLENNRAPVGNITVDEGDVTVQLQDLVAEYESN